MKERSDSIIVDQNAMLQTLKMHASCSVEAEALESVCCAEHICRTPEDPVFFRTDEHTHRTSVGLDTKPNAKEVHACLELQTKC